MRPWLIVVAGVSAAVACSLNPQPLPPGTYDAGAGGRDGAVMGFDDAGALSDATLPPPDDASSEDADAANVSDSDAADATTDGGDAGIAGDAAEDDAADGD